MGKILHPEDLVARIKRLETEVANLKRGSTLGNSVLSRGTTEVRTDTGQVIQRTGLLPWAGTTVWGTQTLRANGTVSSINWDTDDGGGYFAFLDEAQNIIISNDTVSGVGLATPYLQYRPMPFSEVLSPPRSTTSGSVTTLHRCHGQHQKPWVRAQLITQADAGTTGEVRLSVGGAAIAAVTAVPDGDNSYRVLDAELPGEHMAYVYVDVDARRVSGAGSVRVGVAFVEGRQS